MLLTAIFPLCDTRSFLAEDTGRISSRGFLPARGLFLPGFGAISAGRPRRGAPGGLVCLARRAFRPAGPASLGGKPIRWVWREVWDHGDAVVHFDVGIGARLGQPGMAGRWLAALVEEWTRLLVDIPAARRSKPVELRHAGLLLAPAYVQATTLRSHRVEVRQSWVAAGDPCFFVEWSDGEQLDMRGMPSLVPVGKGVRIAWCELPSAGPRALVGYLAHDGSRSGLSWAGKLRGELAALHIERECLWATLGQIACGRLAPPGKPRLLPPDATSGSAPVLSDAPAEPAASAPGAEEPPPTDWPASNALQRYLNDATSLITRRSQTLPFPSLVGVVEPNQAEASRKDGARFSTALDRALSDLNVRGNVRRKVAGWVSHEVGESLHQVSGDLRKQPNLQKWSPCRPQRPQNGEASRALTLNGPLAVPVPVEPSLTEASLRIRAALGPVGREAAQPGDIVSFVLQIRTDDVVIDLGPSGRESTVPMMLEAGIRDKRLTAMVNSTHFAAPTGEKWMETFVVRRDGVTPDSWCFRARADGERRTYDLSVCFFIDGRPVGSVDVSLPRRPGSLLAAEQSTLDFPLGGERRFTVGITSEARTTRVSWYSPADGVWQPPCDLGFDADARISALGSPKYQGLAALRDFCVSFRLALPEALVDAIDGDAAAEQGLVIVSQATLVPLELLPLKRGRPLLGMVRPVMRWIPKKRAPAVVEIVVRNVGCIRPTYEAKPLSSAEGEEHDLLDRFEALVHAGNRAELDALLKRTDIDLVHFAGHAQQDPVSLKLGDADSIHPDYFWDRPLVREKAPFFFINGCEAGLGRTDVAPTLGNMIATLLRCNFAGVVAPLIVVDSQAARDAAEAFYQAAADGKSVGEAVRAIHALAEAQPDKAGTFLSYVGYGRPDLTLRVPSRRHM